MQEFIDENYLCNSLKEELSKSSNPTLNISQKKINSLKINEENNELIIFTDSMFSANNLASNKRFISSIINKLTEKKYKISITEGKNKIQTKIPSEKKTDNTSKKLKEENNKKITPVLNSGEKKENTTNKKISTTIPYHDPKYKLDNFIVGENSRYAFQIANAIASHPGGVNNPFLVYSNVGLGKTHLVEAIGNEVKKMFPKYKVVYTTCKYFVDELYKSFAKNNTSEYEMIFKNADVLIIDDIQYLEKNGEAAADSLFNLFNSLKDANRQMIFTSDRPAYELKCHDRLTSRLGCGMVAEIQKPPFEVRVAILQYKCQENIKKEEYKNINISDDVIYYIAERLTTNVRELEGALNNLFNKAKEIRHLNREININDAKQILKYLAPEPKQKTKTTPEAIIDKVAKEFDIPKDELIKGKKRASKFTNPRHIAMYLMHECIKGMSLKDVGNYFNGKTHNTVIHSKEKVKQLMNEDKTIKDKISKIKLLF